MFAQSDQRSVTSAQSSADQSKVVDSKLPAKPQKELAPAQSSAQESKPAQQKTQTSKSEESKPKKDDGEEGTEKEKEGTGKKTVSSLILTVKLALLEDPRLFPYEIEVEAGSDEVTLEGKVSTEAEKAAAAKIASTVPTVKSVSNKLEVVKDLPELIAHKQDDFITRHVKDRFAKSATVTAANFDVKTEQGVVSLSGTVRFQVIVLEAAEAAREVPGVKAVRTDKVKIESEG
jgi:hyperosmotically inducible protein